MEFQNEIAQKRQSKQLKKAEGIKQDTETDGRAENREHMLI